MSEFRQTNENDEAAIGAPAITEAQRKELRARLAYHRENPEEPGVPFEEFLKALRKNEK